MASPRGAQRAVDSAGDVTSPTNHGPPVLEVRDLSVTRANTLVLRNVSFTVHEGDYIGMVGPNGGGKTSLMLAILGILPRHSGTVRIFGVDIDSFTDWEKLAYISQDAINFDGQFPLTVRELVGLGRADGRNVGRRLGKTDWDRVDEALHFMGLSDMAGKRIGQLSGGQMQRMFVAKALVGEPRLLFLDEPVAGIDANAQEAFYHRLGLLNKQKGITILIASHDLTAVFYRMSEIMCVNREVNIAPISDDLGMEKILRKAYGDHFHFVLHGQQPRSDGDHG